MLVENNNMTYIFERLLVQCYNVDIKAESLYNVKNGSSIIMSKSSSKNPSNETKHWCFCCLQDKTQVKMPILCKYRVCLFSLLRFFDELFDLIIDDPFLTL